MWCASTQPFSTFHILCSLCLRETYPWICSYGWDLLCCGRYAAAVWSVETCGSRACHSTARSCLPSTEPISSSAPYSICIRFRDSCWLPPPSSSRLHLCVCAQGVVSKVSKRNVGVCRHTSQLRNSRAIWDHTGYLSPTFTSDPIKDGTWFSNSGGYKAELT